MQHCLRHTLSLELDTCCGASYTVLCCLEFEHIRYSSGRLLISLEFKSDGVACLCFRHIEVKNGMTAATADTQSHVSCCANTGLGCLMSISYDLGAMITCLVLLIVVTIFLLGYWNLGLRTQGILAEFLWIASGLTSRWKTNTNEAMDDRIKRQASCKGR